jgi:hypothetical protein
MLTKRVGTALAAVDAMKVPALTRTVALIKLLTRGEGHSFTEHQTNADEAGQ